MADVAALVLAAGAGERFAAAGGVGPKVLAQVNGRPTLSRVLDVASDAGLAPALVVVPSGGSTTFTAVSEREDIRLVENPAARDGIGTSVAIGLEALTSDAGVAACVILLADQPMIDPQAIQRVVTEWRHTGRPVRVRYDDASGHPVLLPRSTWETVLARLRDSTDSRPGGRPDEGARGMLEDLDAVTVVVPGPMPVDIDIPEDLERVGGPA